MTARAGALIVAAALLVTACSSSKRPSVTPTTSSATPINTPAGPPTTAFVAATVPPGSPAGSFPVDISGTIGALDPSTNAIALVLGALPGGLVIIEAGRATVRGRVSSVADLRNGMTAHVIGYQLRTSSGRQLVATIIEVT